MVGCGFSYYKVTFSYIFAKVKIHFKKTNIFYDFSQCLVQKRTVLQTLLIVVRDCFLQNYLVVE